MVMGGTNLFEIGSGFDPADAPKPCQATPNQVLGWASSREKMRRDSETGTECDSLASVASVRPRRWLLSSQGPNGANGVVVRRLTKSPKIYAKNPQRRRGERAGRARSDLLRLLARSRPKLMCWRIQVKSLARFKARSEE